MKRCEKIWRLCKKKQSYRKTVKATKSAPYASRHALRPSAGPLLKVIAAMCCKEEPSGTF